MSSMKGGFSTLNRWFGRKKDKFGTGSSSMGKLSKSSTHLHHLSTDTDLNETSQLEYNRITPVPAATSNAPFEQTFRITVLLPKDQLFVARLGARVPLSKLLSLVCDNKQLDADKYEFRSPVDASQVYSCESTIGAVGLSEIRLCHKSESYDNFNPDVMHKFQRTGAARDSLSSSSDFSSSRHSKVTAKTPSPYSSSNSLNSMDSTGMNYTRTPVVVPPAKVLAPPPRKKRTAPRPPSQICIPEQSVPDIPAASLKSEPAYAVIVKRPQLCMSTPNLSGPIPELDCNGNSSKSPDDDSSDGHYATLDLKPPVAGGPEPTPRKRLLQIKKKTAPAPPPDFQSGGDNISLASLPEPVTPTPNIPQPAPRITTPLPIAPAVSPPLPLVNGNVNGSPNGNVSKVLLNRTPTPEPRSLGSATEDDDNDAASKQADSGIGEPAPSPSASPEPEPEVEAEKSQQESSSEDDEAIKVYNFKLCQTSKVTEPLATSLAELAVLTAQGEDEEEDEVLHLEQKVTLTSGNMATPSSETSLTSWNYSVPISPPPDFSDPKMQKSSAVPVAVPVSPGSPLDEIVDELATIINQQRLDTLIKKQPDPRLAEIEAAKPNRLANFSIATAKTTTRIGRADSFQAGGSGAEAEVTSPGGTLGLRSTSHASLNKLEQNGLGQRRSSSELSIGESPSLQSLEVIKTILNSRKNSLAESGSSASSPVTEQPKIFKLAKEESSVDGVSAPKQSPTPIQKPSPTPAVEKPSSPVLNIVQESHPVLKQSPTPIQKQLPSPVEKPSLPPVVKSVQEPVTPVVPKEKQSPPVAKKEGPVPAPKPSPPAVKKVPEPSPPVQKLLVSPTVQTVKEKEHPMSESCQGTITPQNSPATPVTPVSPVNLRNPNNSTMVVQPSQQIESAPSSKPLPPTYRYSGPPSINFATWSERPKSTVAIKNEGDYIFGGAGKSQGVTSPPAKLTIEVASPILRMGIPQRREYHVPITVKPLKDVSQENHQEEKAVVQEMEDQQVDEETFSVQVKLKPQPKHAEKPLVHNQLPNPIQNQSSTLPRPAKSNRFTLPASQNSSQVVSNLASNSLPRPVSSLERNRPMEANPAPAPFGQNTLRRTGFKERMLAREQQEQEQALRIRVSVNGFGNTSSPAATVAGAATRTSLPERKPEPPAKNVNVVLKSTKVELKLQEPEPRPVSLQVKLKPTSQPAATPSPPPPPPTQMLPTLKPVKSNGGRSSGPTSPDPRSQLLDAIRNFKREELNRS
ncbi:proteoglycan 4 [Drosophila suzukii]|uniref:Proteoglycan 4 n=1 Tax=Drosophila suzukii TaxID=28584 RepID=A0AB40DHU9_DROSZ